MDISLDFKPGQIVFLEHGDQRLYGEVIQVVVSRQLCWVRPLMLVAFNQEAPLVTQLTQVSDLLWYINLFQPALDTEVVTLLSKVLAKEPKQDSDSFVNQQFHQFLQQVWQAHKQD
jgi:hypothetical protein